MLWNDRLNAFFPLQFYDMETLYRYVYYDTRRGTIGPRVASEQFECEERVNLMLLILYPITRSFLEQCLLVFLRIAAIVKQSQLQIYNSQLK